MYVVDTIDKQNDFGFWFCVNSFVIGIFNTFPELFMLKPTLFLAAISAAPTQDSLSGLKIPDSCKGQRFCYIKPEGYDRLVDEINSVLPPSLTEQYEDRDGGAMDLATRESPKSDWHNCPYTIKTESTYLHMHGSNETKIDIFVQTNLFRQYVEVVKCEPKLANIGPDDEEQCFRDMNVSKFGMKSKCITTTSTRTLYVYDIERKKVIQKSYEVPACCSCKITSK